MSVLLSLADKDKQRLEACALKLRASKTAVVEALLLIACGEVGEHPLANYLVSRGMTSPEIDMRNLTPEEASAKRPRGARVSGKLKGNHQAGVAAGTSSSSHEGKKKGRAA